MSESTGEATARDAATLTDVLAALQGEVDTLPAEFDQVIIRRGTPWQYAYRVYLPGDSEYEGGVLTFDD